MEDQMAIILEKIIDYNDGTGEYYFAHLDSETKANESYDAWMQIRMEIEQILSEYKNKQRA